VAFNLFVAYDLMSPGQNYDAVRDRIRELGVTWQFQYSLFYLHTNLAPQLVFERITAVMDGNDKLAVIVAEQALGAIVTNWDHPPISEINEIWAVA
jgi:hypothetical protein